MWELSAAFGVAASSFVCLQGEEGDCCNELGSWTSKAGGREAAELARESVGIAPAAATGDCCIKAGACCNEQHSKGTLMYTVYHSSHARI